jgi:hypothetical protein
LTELKVMVLDRFSATLMPYLYTVWIDHTKLATEFSRCIVISS